MTHRGFRSWLVALALLAGASSAAAHPERTSSQPAGGAAAPLRAADAAMAAGRFTDAASEYERWLAAHPGSADVLFALGTCYVELGRRDDAIAAFRKYVRLRPDRASGHAALGVALLDGPSTAEGRRHLERALALNPSEPNAVESLARVYLVEGTPAKAIEVLQRASRGRTADAPGRTLLLGESFVRAGRPADASHVLEPMLDAPGEVPPQAFVLAAWARIKAGETAAAAAICERGMRSHPDSEVSGVYLSLPGPLLAERTAARLEQLSKSPNVPELIAVGRVLTDVDPAGKTRAHELAVTVLGQAVEMDPGNASAHYNYGRALKRTSADRAVAEWERALALDPPDELRLLVYSALASTRDAQSDADGAEQAYRASLDIDRRLRSRVPDPAIEYARFLQLHQRPDEAVAVLDEVRSWNPWSPEVRIERARLLAAQEQWRGVVEEAEFVVRAAADDEALVRVAHLLLAQGYYRLQQRDKAQVHRAWLESH